MIDLINRFDEKLILKEIKGFITPETGFVKDSSIPDFNNPNFPPSLNEFYRQVDLIDIYWHISPRENGQKMREILNQDSWIKENYWDLSDGWGIMEDYMSGNIGIQKSEDMLNLEFVKEHIFDGLIDGLNSEEFMPFDLHWDIMACLKTENGRVLDNVWIVYYNANTMYDMKIGIEKYLDLCYKAKGFYHWQLVYAFQNEEDQDYQLMKRYLPILFSHLELDLSEFGI